MKVRLQGMLATSAAAVAILASASVAQADGMPGGPAYYERPALWTGAYVGVQSGYQWSDINVLNPASPPGFKVHYDEPMVGGFIGYQYQFGQVVVGAEADLLSAFLNNNGDSALCPDGSHVCRARLDNIITVGGRVGWSLGNWLPYASGGYANGSFHFTGESASTGVVAERAGGRDSGWYVGGGLDWKLTRNVVVGFEYRHYEFDQVDRPAFSGATSSFVETARFNSPTTDSVMVRGSLLFNPTYVAAPLK
jgi:outer membrane immunogenic protein